MTGPAPTLAGKTALVTGATTGIGRAIAAAVAAAGARVVINHPHTPELAEKVIAGIEAADGTALAIAAGISRRDEYQAMVSRMLAEYGRWDVLVNNAAVAITKPFAQVTEAEFDRSFAVIRRESSATEGSAPGTRGCPGADRRDQRRFVARYVVMVGRESVARGWLFRAASCWHL